jgi:hypothetical protein
MLVVQKKNKKTKNTKHMLKRMKTGNFFTCGNQVNLRVFFFNTISATHHPATKNSSNFPFSPLTKCGFVSNSDNCD